MKYKSANKINLSLIYIITLSPLLSYFIVSFTSVKSGAYVFNAFIGLAALVLILQNFRNKSIRFPFYLRYLLLFSLYVIFSDLYIAEKPSNFNYFFKNQVLFGFLAAFVIENTHFPRQYITQLTKLLKGMFWISVGVILMQQFMDYNFMLNPHALEELEATDELERRFSSIYSYLGGTIYAGFTVIPVMAIIVTENIRRKKPALIYYVAGAIFSIINKSRWILINLILTIFVRYNYKKISFLKACKIIVAIGIVSMATFYTLKFFDFDVEGLVAERLLETNHGGLDEGAASTRLLAFEIFGQVYPDNPVLGKGNLSWGEGATGDKELTTLLKGRSSQIHVGFLSLFYWYGMIGSLFFIFFLYHLFKKMHTTAKKLNYWGPFWGMFGFVAANLTLVYLNINVPGLLLCLVYNRYYEQLYRDWRLSVSKEYTIPQGKFLTQPQMT